MSILDKLERRLGRLAIPNLTLVVIVAQIIVFSVWFTPMDRDDQKAAVERLTLVPALVLQGEVWRLATFVAVFPYQHLLFAVLAWYMFYLMGTALENHWGTFRYNVFLLVGWLLTVAVSFVNPDLPATPAFWQGSVFLAFAALYPRFIINLLFILPVEIRWLALLAWIGYGWSFVTGDWQTRLVILAAVGNFLLFFSRDIVERIVTGHRQMARRAAALAVREPEYYHRCRVCGITDRSHPQMDFRYCSKCAGDCCYCADHLRAHEHVTAAESPPAP